MKMNSEGIIVVGDFSRQISGFANFSETNSSRNSQIHEILELQHQEKEHSCEDLDDDSLRKSDSTYKFRRDQNERNSLIINNNSHIHKIKKNRRIDMVHQASQIRPMTILRHQFSSPLSSYNGLHVKNMVFQYKNSQRNISDGNLNHYQNLKTFHKKRHSGVCTYSSTGNSSEQSPAREGYKVNFPPYKSGSRAKNCMNYQDSRAKTPSTLEYKRNIKNVQYLLNRKFDAFKLLKKSCKSKSPNLSKKNRNQLHLVKPCNSDNKQEGNNEKTELKQECKTSNVKCDCSSVTQNDSHHLIRLVKPDGEVSGDSKKTIRRIIKLHPEDKTKPKNNHSMDDQALLESLKKQLPLKETKSLGLNSKIILSKMSNSNMKISTQRSERNHSISDFSKKKGLLKASKEKPIMLKSRQQNTSKKEKEKVQLEPTQIKFNYNMQNHFTSNKESNSNLKVREDQTKRNPIIKGMMKSLLFRSPTGKKKGFSRNVKFSQEKIEQVCKTGSISNQIYNNNCNKINDIMTTKINKVDELRQLHEINQIHRNNNLYKGGEAQKITSLNKIKRIKNLEREIERLNDMENILREQLERKARVKQVTNLKIYKNDQKTRNRGICFQQTSTSKAEAGIVQKILIEKYKNKIKTLPFESGTSQNPQSQPKHSSQNPKQHYSQTNPHNQLTQPYTKDKATILNHKEKESKQNGLQNKLNYSTIKYEAVDYSEGHYIKRTKQERIYTSNKGKGFSALNPSLQMQCSEDASFPIHQIHTQPISNKAQPQPLNMHTHNTINTLLHSNTHNTQPSTRNNNTNTNTNRNGTRNRNMMLSKSQRSLLTNEAISNRINKNPSSQLSASKTGHSMQISSNMIGSINHYKFIQNQLNHSAGGGDSLDGRLSPAPPHSHKYYTPAKTSYDFSHKRSSIQNTRANVLLSSNPNRNSYVFSKSNRNRSFSNIRRKIQNDCPPIIAFSNPNDSFVKAGTSAPAFSGSMVVNRNKSVINHQSSLTKLNASAKSHISNRNFSTPPRESPSASFQQCQSKEPVGDPCKEYATPDPDAQIKKGSCHIISLNSEVNTKNLNSSYLHSREKSYDYPDKDKGRDFTPSVSEISAVCTQRRYKTPAKNSQSITPFLKD